MPEKNRLAFTKNALEKLPAPTDGRVYYYDAKTPALALCVTSNDVRTFYLAKRIQGAYKRIKIGRFPEVTVEQARKKASKLTGDIADGRDPTAEKRFITCGELFDAWIAHAKSHKRTWQEDERLIKKFLAAWKPRRITAVTRADVQRLHSQIGTDNGPYQANRVLALIRAIWYQAPNYGHHVENPAVGIQRFKEESRDRFLQPDELPRFFAALAEEPDETLRDFFLIALLVGARRGNIQQMRFEEICFSPPSWRIPQTKSGLAVFVHLPPAAVEILARRHADYSHRSPYVFPSRSRTGHIVEPKSAWKRIITRAGIRDLRIHDLRRTLGSWQAMNGTSLPIIGKSLGHKSLASTSVYARLTLEPVVESVNAATNAILQAAKGGDNERE
jgi:integrase